MKILSKKLLLISILFFEFILAFYTFNYTIRTKSPSFIYTHKNNIKIACISSTGEDIIVYDESQSISFITRNRLSWNYEVKAEIIDMKISSIGDYFIILDNNFTISLFSKNIELEKLTPFWSYHIPFCKIRDIYSAGSVPPLVYVLVSNGNNLILFTREGTQIRSFKLFSEDSISKISWDGSWIVTIDSKGLVYLFNIEENKTHWTLKTGIIKSSLEISLDNRFILIGGEKEENGKGLIYLILLKTGEVKFKKEFDIPIKKVTISSNGNKAFILYNDGSVLIIYMENENIRTKNLNFDRKIESIFAPPYGSYFLGVDCYGEIFLFHLSRAVPLWNYPTRSKNAIISTSSNGEKIFIAEFNKINILLNSSLTEIIPGSRSLWAIIFSIGVLIILNLSLFFMKKYKIIIGEKHEIFTAIAGFSIGTFFGILQLKSLINSVIFCGLPFSASCTFSYKKKSLISFLVSCYLGCIFSGAIGFIYGLSKWLLGDERDIIQLTIYYTIYGLNIGVLYVILGGIIGILITICYNKWLKINIC